MSLLPRCTCAGCGIGLWDDTCPLHWESVKWWKQKQEEHEAKLRALRQEALTRPTHGGYPPSRAEGELKHGEGGRNVDARSPDLSGCEVMVDGVGITLESSKPFNFTCCDCGLTHRCVIVSEDDKPVGFAVERDPLATAERRCPASGSADTEGPDLMKKVPASGQSSPRTEGEVKHG